MSRLGNQGSFYIFLIAHESEMKTSISDFAWCLSCHCGSWCFWIQDLKLIDISRIDRHCMRSSPDQEESARVNISLHVLPITAVFHEPHWWQKSLSDYRDTTIASGPMYAGSSKVSKCQELWPRNAISMSKIATLNHTSLQSHTHNAIEDVAS